MSREDDIRDRAQGLDQAYSETPVYHEKEPDLKVEGGAAIRCDRCQAWHRLQPAFHKRTREVIRGTFLFNCSGTLRLGAKGFKLEEGLVLVRPGQDEEFGRPKREGYPREKGARG